ncbi:MAG: phytanoyl-CoA dioxygenase family protein, partial [Burkholderiales bacterium]|nr:phytanoyl-CoA dioxygenase family protein [Burkholderiales bacterium]
MSPDADDPMSRRDLAFKPVANPAPRVLTAEQIERYNRDGYLMPFPIYNAAGAARNRAYFDRLLAMLKA